MGVCGGVHLHKKKKKKKKGGISWFHGIYDIRKRVLVQVLIGYPADRIIINPKCMVTNNIASILSNNVARSKSWQIFFRYVPVAPCFTLRK